MQNDNTTVIPFTKMQAFGNDYVYIDTIGRELKEPGRLARCISDRHFGVGSDGLVLLCASADCDFRMRIFNPDGSEAEMCGNALRSAAMLYYCNGHTKKEAVTVETLGGRQSVWLTVKDGEVINIHAKIGRPVFAAREIPVDTKKPVFLDEPLIVGDRTFRASSLSFGNPHTVLLTDDLETLPIEIYGRGAECHPYFPRRTNVTFARVADESHIEIREWERGCGETLGCGTGCCAALAVAHRLGLCGRRAFVRQPGGTLYVEWDEEDQIHMKGPSHIVCRGEFYYRF